MSDLSAYNTAFVAPYISPYPLKPSKPQTPFHGWASIDSGCSLQGVTRHIGNLPNCFCSLNAFSILPSLSHSEGGTMKISLCINHGMSASLQYCLRVHSMWVLEQEPCFTSQYGQLRKENILKKVEEEFKFSKNMFFYDFRVIC